ncbi:MAG: peptidylprolyl isomerase [Actinomycetota bacterium]|nr:peptidylprolyl isomerase [Actinomycetota bacterium]
MLAIASIGLAVALGACGDDDDEPAQETGTTTTEAAPATTTQPPQSEADGGCEQVTQPKGGERTGKKPKVKLDAKRTYELVFATNCGEFTITLDLEAAPLTSASLVALAKAKFFDGTAFHRIVPGFVIQGGDPTASGQGGPGYSTLDKPPPNTRYTKGVVAMAKTQAEPPGTAGSQFFVVVGDDAGLPPEYAVVGKVTDGMDVVERIGQQGDPASEQPLRPVVIESAKVEES